MIRALLVLAVTTTALPAWAAGPAAHSRHTGDDSFLYAAPAAGAGRVPNYVADSAKGQPLDHNDRRKFDRPYLSGESTGLKLQGR